MYCSPEEANSQALDQFIRGTVAAEMENHYQAVFHFQEALRSDPKAPYIYVALAQEYVLLSQPGRALEIIEGALDLDPHYSEALELKAAILRSTGKYPEAIQTLEELIKTAPEKYSYYYELLFGYLSTGEFDKADDIYAKYILGQPDIARLIRQILSVYVMAAEYDRAVPYMQQLLESDSLDASLIYSMGTLYLQVGDTATGETLIQRAISLDPAEPRYWFAQAVLEYERENFSEVLQIAEDAAQSAGDQANFYNLVGNTHQRMEQPEEAIAAFQRAIELDSTYFTAMGSLALLYDGIDSLSRVVELYERTIQLSDSAPVYLNNLAYTYADRGIELEKARELVSIALQYEPENASYLDTMGWIEFQAGNYSEAIDWIRRALKHDSRSAPLYEHLGDCYLQSGKESKARKYYRKGLSLDPDNESLQRKLGQR